MPYCPDCGIEVTATAAFCSECGTPQDRQETSTDQREEPPGGWWLGVLLPPLAIVVPMFLAFTAGFVSGLIGANDITAILSIVEWIFYIGTGASIFISPIAFHIDKRYVKSVSGWEPSSAYYLLCVPLLNAVLALGYINQRHAALK